MNSVAMLMNHPLLERLGWTLLHFLWQGALAALLLSVLMVALRRRSPNARYAAAGACLLAMALAPLATFCLIEPGETTVQAPQTNPIPAFSSPKAASASVSAAHPPTPDYAPSSALPQSASRTPQSSTPHSDSWLLSPVSSIPHSAFRIPHFAQSLPAWLGARLPWLVAGWMAGVLLLSLRLLGGLARVRQLTRCQVQPVEERWRARMDELAHRLRVSRPVRLLESAAAAAPLALGWLKPVILLPASALSGLKSEQLEALIAHELAHIRRHDYLVNLLQTAIETILYYHPAVWWASRRMRIEREFCCDDLAAQACGNTVAYARALAEMEGLRARLPRPALAVSGGSLLERVARLVGRPTATPPRGASWLAGALALAMLTGLGCVVTLTGQARVANAKGKPAKLVLRLAAPQSELAKGFRATVLRLADWNKRPTKPDVNAIDNQQIFWSDEKRKEVWTIADYQWDAKDGTFFENLRPGAYQVLAEGETEDGLTGPRCLSETIRLEAEQDEAEVRLSVPAGGPLTVRVRDARSGKPLGSVGVKLMRQDGMPLTRGTLWTDLKGVMRFSTVPPGKYTVVVERRLSFYSEAEYTKPGEAALTMEPEKEAAVEIALEPTPLTREKIDNLWPFIVEGKVTDEGGKPLEGVKLRVNGGMGTLHPVGEALSGADGKYTVRFGPAMLSSGGQEKWPASIYLQAATIYAGKDDYYESTLCRGGDLGMAGKLPEKDESDWFKNKRIVLPGKPYNLHFMMLPAAQVSGRMVDPQGKPVAGKHFYMYGPTGPSASVMAGDTTGPDGRFKLASLPCRPYAFGFSEKDGERRVEVRSSELNFAKAGPYELELVYDAKAHKLDCRVVAAPVSMVNHAASATKHEKLTGETTRAILQNQLGSRDWQQRAEAARKIGDFTTNEVMFLLLDMLAKEKHPAVRASIYRSLGCFGDSRAIAPLIKALDGDDDQEREAAWQVLKPLGWKQPQAEAQRLKLGINLPAKLLSATPLATQNMLEGPFLLDVPIGLPLALGAQGKTGVLQLQSIEFRQNGEELRAFVEDRHGLPPTDWRVNLELLDATGATRSRAEEMIHTNLGYSGNVYRTERIFPDRIELGKVENLTDITRFRLSFRDLPKGQTEQTATTAAQAMNAPGQETPLPAGTVMFSHTADASPDKLSLGASGHATEFERREFTGMIGFSVVNKAKFIEAVDIYASRYGMPKAPDENFHLYVLNEKFQVLADVEFPYAMIERGAMKWYRLRTPSIEVPEKFHIALDFNPHQTKGIYLGLDKTVKESHSFTGLPAEGYVPLKDKADWMIRPWLGETPSNAKGTKRLADWRPPQPQADPFAGCLEVKLADGVPDGMQSYGGAGAALKLKLAELLPQGTDLNKVKLKGFRVFAGRYGSGYDVNASLVTAMILDQDARPLWNFGWPYARFSYKNAWVELALDQPVAVGPYLQNGELTVGFDPQAHQTKGIYWQYRKVAAGKGHSLGVAPAKKFFETPEREWMIKVYFGTVE